MIKSYMVIDRKERSNEHIIAVCEVEAVPMNDQKRMLDPLNVDTFMVDVPERMFLIKGIVPLEQGIYSVFHDGQNVYEVCELTIEERENW